MLVTSSYMWTSNKIVTVHSYDSMRLACANAVLAVHCNYCVHVFQQKCTHYNTEYVTQYTRAMHLHVVVAVHSQDSMRLACVNAVLAVHCNYFVGSSYYKDMHVLYAVIQNWLQTSTSYKHTCLLLRNFQQMYVHARIIKTHAKVIFLIRDCLRSKPILHVSYMHVYIHVHV